MVYTDEELLQMTPAQLVDAGICPTCFNREHNGTLYGDNVDKLLYEDSEIECFLVGNPRAEGHMCISTIEHFHDMSEAPDHINEKMIRFAKRFMKIIRDIYKCERVYMCTMCDGPNNHYHIQLIPRYSFEKRGSNNFVKPRKAYVFDEQKFLKLKEAINDYAIDEDIKLVEYYPNYQTALAWYQDLELCKQVDNRNTAYDVDTLKAMYKYLDKKGDLYYIKYKNRLCGDVCLQPHGEINIVVAKPFQNKHIGRRVIYKMIHLAKAKGIKELHAVIYSFNTQSQTMFKSVGFQQVDSEKYVLIL